MVLTKLTRDLFWQAVGLLADKKRDGDGKTSLKPGQVGRVRQAGHPSGVGRSLRRQWCALS